MLIFRCRFAVIGSGFEHSVANMTLLASALFQQHGDVVTWAGYIRNVMPDTLGNLDGGVVLVGGANWQTAVSPSPRLLPVAPPVVAPIAPRAAGQ